MSLTLSLCGPVKAVCSFGQIWLISFRGATDTWRTFNQGDGPGLGEQNLPPSSPIVPAKPNFPAIQKVTFGPNSTGHNSPRSNKVTVVLVPDPMNISSPAQSF